MLFLFELNSGQGTIITGSRTSNDRTNKFPRMRFTHGFITQYQLLTSDYPFGG
jgi:hypothetical protein